MLLVQGEGGTLEAFDGETGQKRWNASHRLHGSAFTLPGSCRRMVAVISGSNLFVLNRENGRLLQEIPMASVGMTAPTISNFRIIVPLMDGRLATWPIIPDGEWIDRMEDEKHALPENVAKINAERWANLRLDPMMNGMVDHLFSVGLVETPICTTLRLPSNEYYAWSSDAGTFFVAKLQTFRSGLQIIPLFQAKLEVPTRRQVAYIPPVGWPADRDAAMKLVEAQRAASVPTDESTDTTKEPVANAAGESEVALEEDPFAEGVFADDSAEDVEGATAEEATAEEAVDDIFSLEEEDPAESTEPTEQENSVESTEPIVEGEDESPVVTMKVTAEGIPNLPLDSDLGTVVLVDERGQVYAFDQRTGEVRWRGSIRSKPLGDPVAVDRKVFLHSTLGGTFCIDGDTGEVVWNIREPLRFLAASRTRFYGEDATGRIAILSLSDGSTVERFPTNLLHQKIINTDTDRIYLVNETGLIQCFHEPGLERPIHRTLPDPDPELGEEYIAGLRRKDKQGKAATASTATADTGFDPFAEGAVAEEESGESDPFADADPFADEGANGDGEDDPFGDAAEIEDIDDGFDDSDPFAE